jgi:hypothetical protein
VCDLDVMNAWRLACAARSRPHTLTTLQHFLTCMHAPKHAPKHTGARILVGSLQAWPAQWPVLLHPVQGHSHVVQCLTIRMQAWGWKWSKKRAMLT